MPDEARVVRQFRPYLDALHVVSRRQGEIVQIGGARLHLRGRYARGGERILGATSDRERAGVLRLREGGGRGRPIRQRSEQEYIPPKAFVLEISLQVPQCHEFFSHAIPPSSVGIDLVSRAVRAGKRDGKIRSRRHPDFIEACTRCRCIRLP